MCREQVGKQTLRTRLGISDTRFEKGRPARVAGSGPIVAVEALGPGLEIQEGPTHAFFEKMGAPSKTAIYFL